MDPTDVPAEIISANFRAVMRQFPATVTIITGRVDGVDHGMTATAVTSVSMDPPSLLVCLNNRTYLHDMLSREPGFVVNILSTEHAGISDAFSGKVSPEERFTHGEWVRHPASGLLTLQSAHARAVCRRVAAVPYGTHTLFIGRVLDAFTADGTRPLLYENAQYCSTTTAI